MIRIYLLYKLNLLDIDGYRFVILRAEWQLIYCYSLLTVIVYIIRRWPHANIDQH